MTHYLTHQLLLMLKQARMDAKLHDDQHTDHHVGVIDLTNTHGHYAEPPSKQVMPNSTPSVLSPDLLKQYPDCFSPLTQQQFRYTVHRSHMPHTLAALFEQLDCDEATHSFLHQCCAEYSGSYVSSHYLKNALLKPMLKMFYNHTDCNGMLGTGSMFVVSTKQCRQLLSRHLTQCNNNILLDIGAGDGNVTAQLRPLFSRVYTTEVSARMIHTLRNTHMFHCYDSTDLKHIFDDITQLNHGVSPSVIGLFNVIDRCDKPLTLLSDIYKLMSDTSVLILAAVLPLKPSVESDSGVWHTPTESIITRGRTCCMSYEDSVTALIEDVIEPIGYCVKSISRVPYISAGDTVKPFYLLQDVILVLGKH